jgi:hypothetical protein
MPERRFGAAFPDALAPSGGKGMVFLCHPRSTVRIVVMVQAALHTQKGLEPASIQTTHPTELQI